MSVSPKRAVFTPEDKNVLKSLVRKYAPILDSKISSRIIYRQKDRQWNLIAHEFNSSPQISCKRIPAQLRSLYSNLKSQEREKRNQVFGKGDEFTANDTSADSALQMASPHFSYKVVEDDGTVSNEDKVLGDGVPMDDTSDPDIIEIPSTSVPFKTTSSIKSRPAAAEIEWAQLDYDRMRATTAFEKEIREYRIAMETVRAEGEKERHKILTDLETKKRDFVNEKYKLEIESLTAKMKAEVEEAECIVRIAKIKEENELKIAQSRLRQESLKERILEQELRKATRSDINDM